MVEKLRNRFESTYSVREQHDGRVDRDPNKSPHLLVHSLAHSVMINTGTCTPYPCL